MQNAGPHPHEPHARRPHPRRQADDRNPIRVPEIPRKPSYSREPEVLTRAGAGAVDPDGEAAAGYGCGAGQNRTGKREESVGEDEAHRGADMDDVLQWEESRVCRQERAHGRRLEGHAAAACGVHGSWRAAGRGRRRRGGGGGAHLHEGSL